MKKIILVFLFLSFSLFIFNGCRDQQHEQELIKREQALQLREDSFAQKENEYRSLLKMKDSLIAIKDSLKSLPVTPWPDSIAGKWYSKLICTESNCNDYVIGDQRTYIWDFNSDSLKLITKVLDNKNEVVRIYDAGYSPGKIHLSFQTDSTVSKPVTMNVVLNKLRKNKLKGTHTISIGHNCTAKFSVELTRPNLDK
jgi:hypothetical protein